MQDRWADAPLVVVLAPACPSCGASRPVTVRSMQNGDGSVTRRSVCRECSERFNVLVELPESGNYEITER